MASASDRTGEATDLLQHLIRNRCVNDGTAASGQEQRSADLLRTYLEGSGVDIESYEPVPGRTSLVAKLHGSDPHAPSLTLLGHTDVVPANADDWSHDPFAGELIDGEVWGRGAIDMLNLTATMATSLRHLALTGFRPAGDLTYVAVADEEALGNHGAKWLCDHVADEVNADYVITESGGFPMRRGRRHHSVAGDRGREGRLLVPAGDQGHPGAREPAATHRQRTGQGGRSGPPHRRVPTTGRNSTRRGPGSSMDWASPPTWPNRSSTPTASTSSATSSPWWAWPGRPTPVPTPPWPRR